MFPSDTDTTPKYIFTPHSCMTPDAYGDANNGPWLDDALPLDAGLMTTAPEVKVIIDAVFDDIIKSIEADGTVKNTRTKLSQPRLKQTCKIILLNLYVAYLMGSPVRYSRDKSRYGKNRRYGKLFFKYSRVIATVKAFSSLGLIAQKPWVNDREKGFGRQTRMWATPNLIAHFHQVEIYLPQRVAQEDRAEFIELRDENKKPVGYAETKQTRLMRKNLLAYNDFIEQQEVLVEMSGPQQISLDNLAKKLYSNFITGDLTLDKLTVYKDRIVYIQKERVQRYESTASTLPSMTQDIFSYDSVIKDLNDGNFIRTLGEKYTSTACYNAINLPLLSVIIRKHLFLNRKNQELNEKKIPLAEFGIQQLDFIINNKKLHRVFNRNSFELGGRFYGGYQVLPKKVRARIKINNEPTVELDYSAHHIRIAYHLEGIDYKDDPYLAMKEDPDAPVDEQERTVFKLLLLVVMNAETESSAIGGFRDSNRSKLKKLLGDLKDSTIKPLLQRAKEAHPKIAHYFHSDAGVKLQYIDSQITEAILMIMSGQGIPCLPIHDSYRVPCQYEEQLLEAMMEEYRQVMGFEPIVERQ